VPVSADLPAEVEQADAGAGGAGAPPDPAARNDAPAGLTREYHAAGITVQWYAERCIHSGDCIRALPRVFNPRRRPWVRLDAAAADAIAEAVLSCPTGALHYIRHDGAEQEPTPAETTIRTVHNGPYLVGGPVRIMNDAGEVIREDTRIALCRCGRSAHMPFCDNSHRALGFDDAAGGDGSHP
jgi:uncharacterized Fe-S cluster protein YjdI/CDGSH-type Zn-finger protein